MKVMGIAGSLRRASYFDVFESTSEAREGTAESAEIAEKAFLCDLCVLRGFF